MVRVPIRDRRKTAGQQQFLLVYPLDARKTCDPTATEVVFAMGILQLFFLCTAKCAQPGPHQNALVARFCSVGYVLGAPMCLPHAGNPTQDPLFDSSCMIGLFQRRVVLRELNFCQRSE